MADVEAEHTTAGGYFAAARRKLIRRPGYGG